MTMFPQDLLDEISVKIYSEPLSIIRSSGSIRDLSVPLHVIMLTVDFLTERDMNGIWNFFGNSTGLYALDTVAALTSIKARRSAEKLSRMVEIASVHGMTYSNIQRDRADNSVRRGSEHSFVTSWDETHGDKWKVAQRLIDDIDRELDEDEIRECLLQYVVIHQHGLETMLRDR